MIRRYDWRLLWEHESNKKAYDGSLEIVLQMHEHGLEGRATKELALGG